MTRSKIFGPGFLAGGGGVFPGCAIGELVLLLQLVQGLIRDKITVVVDQSNLARSE